MTRIRLISKVLSLAIFLLPLPALAGEAVTKMIRAAPVWIGAGFEADGANWSMRVVFGPDGASIRYPSLDCGGRWTREADDNGAAIYREDITYGQANCASPGQIRLVPTGDGGLAYEWREMDGGPILALGVLFERPEGGLPYAALLGQTLSRIDPGFRDIQIVD